MIVTLDQLVTQVRRRADMENSSFVTDDEIKAYVQDSYNELVDLLYESGILGATATTLTTTPGNPTVELGVPVYKVVQLTVQDGQRTVRLAPHSGPIEADSRGGGWHDLRAVKYSVGLSFTEDATPSYGGLIFNPTPQAVHTLYLQYVPHPPDLATGTVDLVAFARWHEYVVVDAAAKCLEKEETDARHLYKRKAELESRIRFHAMTMNLDSGGRVRNVDG